MGRQVGACWALIGFAIQCFQSLLEGVGVAQGLTLALIHYVAWGTVGFLVGVTVEQAVDESFLNTRQAASRPTGPPPTESPAAPNESAR